MNNVEVVSSILEGVQLDEGLLEQVTFDEHIGFLAIQAESQPEDNITLLGFYAPTVGRGLQVPKVLQTPAALDEVPPADRTIDVLGKGKGIRLYNSAQATAGLSHIPDYVGAYTYSVDWSAILDTRQKSEASLQGKLGRIAQHAGRILGSKKRGLEEVVADIEAGYGDAEAVIVSQPPAAALRQYMRGVANPIPPAFAMVRRMEPINTVGYRRSPARNLT